VTPFISVPTSAVRRTIALRGGAFHFGENLRPGLAGDISAAAVAMGEEFLEHVA
jgi:hypothetical protein